MIGRQATATTTTCAALLALASAILGGCGAGATKTVTVAGAGAGGSAARAAMSSTTSPGARARTTPTTTQSTNAGTQQSAGGAASTTRTAPEPAFAQHAETTGGEASGEEAAAAVAMIKTHGYTPDDVSQYHPHQTLRVLLGTRTGSADGYEQQAFFFLDGGYLGTDSSQPSASIRLVAQSDTEVVLAYTLYRPHDPLCCATGGQATVHFQLNDGRLVPLQSIPPANSASGPSRQ